MSTKLHYAKVTADNLSLALQIQGIVWPRNPVDRDYLLKADDADDANVSWLVYRDAPLSLDHLIGLTGVFTYDPDEPGYDDGESIWMDWFAVLPHSRRQGFGAQILRDTISYAQSLNRFSYFRLDTTDFPGRASTKLYDQVMAIREDYTGETYAEGYRGLVYSCSLGNFPVKPWDNHRLGLKLYGAIESVVI